MLLNQIYYGINKCIIEDITLKSLKLITPINELESIKNIKHVYLYLNKNTLLTDFETEETIASREY